MKKFDLFEWIAGGLVSGFLAWAGASCLDIAYNSLYQPWNLISLILEVAA